MPNKDNLAVQLGQRIRQLRRERRLTLIELSKYTGVAQATLSRIETGMMTGTVESHQKIADILGVSLAELYQGVDKKSVNAQIQAAGHSRKATVKTDRLSMELLTHEISKKKLIPLLLSIQSETASSEEKLDRGAEKFVYVIEGTLIVKLGEEEYVLNKEDSLYFDASVSHKWINNSGKSCKALVIISPSRA